MKNPVEEKIFCDRIFSRIITGGKKLWLRQELSEQPDMQEAN